MSIVKANELCLVEAVENCGHLSVRIKPDSLLVIKKISESFGLSKSAIINMFITFAISNCFVDLEKRHIILGDQDEYSNKT